MKEIVDPLQTSRILAPTDFNQTINQLQALLIATLYEYKSTQPTETVYPFLPRHHDGPDQRAGGVTVSTCAGHLPFVPLPALPSG